MCDVGITKNKTVDGKLAAFNVRYAIVLEPYDSARLHDRSRKLDPVDIGSGGIAEFLFSSTLKIM
jgi:hypothetical protein